MFLCPKLLENEVKLLTVFAVRTVNWNNFYFLSEKSGSIDDQKTKRVVLYLNYFHNTSSTQTVRQKKHKNVLEDIDAKAPCWYDSNYSN